MGKSATPVFAVMVLCLLPPVLAFADPIITNGSFEAVQITAPFSSNPADIPGWTHTGDIGVRFCGTPHSLSAVAAPARQRPETATSSLLWAGDLEALVARRGPRL